MVPDPALHIKSSFLNRRGGMAAEVGMRTGRWTDGRGRQGRGGWDGMEGKGRGGERREGGRDEGRGLRAGRGDGEGR